MEQLSRSNRSGFTKFGFSKNGFSACGHFSFCSLGKGECYWSERDPEVKEYCFCYIRNHNRADKSPTKEIEPEDRSFSYFTEEELTNRQNEDILADSKKKESLEEPLGEKETILSTSAKANTEEVVGISLKDTNNLKVGKSYLLKPSTYTSIPSVRNVYVYTMDGVFLGSYPKGSFELEVNETQIVLVQQRVEESKEDVISETEKSIEDEIEVKLSLVDKQLSFIL